MGGIVVVEKTTVQYSPPPSVWDIKAVVLTIPKIIIRLYHGVLRNSRLLCQQKEEEEDF
jgi:hypothetical protein